MSRDRPEQLGSSVVLMARDRRDARPRQFGPHGVAVAFTLRSPRVGDRLDDPQAHSAELHRSFRDSCILPRGARVLDVDSQRSVGRCDPHGQDVSLGALGMQHGVAHQLAGNEHRVADDPPKLRKLGHSFAYGGRRVGIAAHAEPQKLSRHRHPGTPHRLLLNLICTGVLCAAFRCGDHA